MSSSVVDPSSHVLRDSLRPLIVYHANCSDGFASAYVAWLRYGNSAEYVALDAHILSEPEGLASLPNIEGRDAIFIDLSLPTRTLNVVRKLASSIVVLDHHETSFKCWSSRNGVCAHTVEKNEAASSGHAAYKLRLARDKAGVLLAWEHFFPGEAIPWLLAYVDDYDRQEFTLDRSKEFNLALLSYQPWSWRQWRGLQDAFGVQAAPATGPLVKFLELGEILQKSHQVHVDEISKSALKCSISGFSMSGIAVCCPALFANDVGSQLADQGAFVLCWHGTSDGFIKCSLRSKQGVAVNHIAEQFGGGGHAFSAAFRLPMKDFADLVTFDCKKSG
ncbi:DHHA1 domain-containing protein [Comamonas thiooxydans]|uniref:DHHA1 domain-containing protein n=1 Tax=Comamonas thiooxydans TaxID=363952 RepID=UPI000B411ECC|nr:DHHA1 domain-containing protein [Comamonas thiooxydans]